MHAPHALTDYIDDEPDWEAIEAAEAATLAEHGGEHEAEALAHGGGARLATPPPGPLATAPTAEPQRGAAPWHALETDAVFGAPWHDVPLMCPGLDLGPGRPCGLIGAPGAGKNDTAQAIGLAVATGLPALGLFPVRRGRVLHLTWDMGARGTALRYRKLAAGMGLTRADLAGQLTLCAHPAITLVGAERAIVGAFAARFEGYELVIVDNARAATPGVPENESEFGEYVNRLGRAAERTGSTVLYLHHAGKGERSGIDAARGSSAIVGASGAVWTISGRGAEPRKLTHERAHEMSDGLRPPVWLTRAAAPHTDIDLGPHVPWRLVGSLEEPASPGEDATSAVLAAVRAAPGSSASEIAASARKRKADVLAVLAGLTARGIVSARSDGKAQKFSLTVQS